MPTGSARLAGRPLDRYVLHGEIASGGMATVHLGRVSGAGGFSRTVAIKRLHPQFVSDPEFSQMFLDEARLAARVRHPNVVPTIDVVDADRELFLVMEYVPGLSLASVIASLRAQAQSMPVAVAARVLFDALSGLHAAHEARDGGGQPLEIVHRDVSPQNILLGEDGMTRVLDFGIARAAVRSRATRDGQIRGKLRYLAPEQLRGSMATRRSDVYSASVVLWEALTCRPLFDGDTDGAVYGRILEGVVCPPSSFVSVPTAVDDVVRRGLERDPTARYATAIDMATDLASAVPLAAPSAVAEWLARVDGATLALRAADVRAIESPESRLDALGAQPPSGVRWVGGATAEFIVKEGVTLAAWQRVPPAQEAPPSERRGAPPSSGGAGSLRPSRFPAGVGDQPTQTVTVPIRPAPFRMWVPPRLAIAAVFLCAAVAAGAIALPVPAGPAAVAAKRGLREAARIAAARVRFEPPGSPEPSEPLRGAAEPPPPQPAVSPQPSVPARAPLAARRKAATDRPSCDPPTYLDSGGIRRVKRGCL